MKGDGDLKGIRIKNVRSLKDTGRVTLPSVTLLVGENSSGKSTFLRTFPLIKQSICKRTDGPLLWAGDVDDYVDFGSFGETVTSDGSDRIEFDFEFPFEFDVRYTHLLTSSFSTLCRKIPTTDVVYSIAISHRGTREFISNLKIHYHETVIEFQAEGAETASAVKVDGMELNDFKKTREKEDVFYYGLHPRHNIFGFPYPNMAGVLKRLLEFFEKEEGQEEELSDLYSRMDVWSISQAIGYFLCVGKTLKEISAAMDALLKQTKAKDRATVQRAAEMLNQLAQTEEPVQEQHLTRLKAAFLFSCLDQMDVYLDTYFRRVHYIAPLRATAERYYRLRNLAIDEVDYQGKNLAIFLNGLTKERRGRFEDWTMKQFGFRVFTEESGGHLSVKIALDKDKGGVNLSDTGFGYSQILPIITQLWDLSTRKREMRQKNVPLVIAVEQPELHLHPAIQAKLVDAFIASIPLAKKNGYSLQIILETHSETIINRFGQAIATRKQDLKPDDVSILLFEKNMKTNQSTVRVSRYNEDGYLQNWPMGFFAP